MQSMEETLHSLRDVDGVHGSFVIAASGALVARDLPAIFDGPLFAEVGPRLARLQETFFSGGEELDSCLLRFSEHKLYLRKMKSGLLGTISAVAVNMPALRMVANLVIRRLDPLLTRASIPPAPTITPLPSGMTQSSMPVPRALPPESVRTTLPVPFAPAAPTPPPPPIEMMQERAAAISEDGRGTPLPSSGRHVRMYRGRRVEE